MKIYLLLLFLSFNVFAEDDLSLDLNDIPSATDSNALNSGATKTPTETKLKDEFAVPEATPAPTQLPAAPEVKETQFQSPSTPAEPTSQRISEPAVQQVTEPRVQQVTEPTAQQVTEPPVQQVTEPPVQQGTEPKGQDVPENMRVHSTEVQANQEPNVRLEEKFNRIYEQFNKNELGNDTWEKIIGERKSETYVVQKGDTLWDISRTLFGDPYFWPKLWAVNKDIIYNPHQIDPRMNIKFYPGSEGAVPSLAMVNKKDNPESAAEEEDPDPEPVSAPAPKKEQKSSPKDRRESNHVTPIPKSFPDYYVNSQNNDKKITLEERVYKPLNPSIPLEFVLKESEIQPQGRVSEIETGTNTASIFQYLYVKLNDSGIKHFTVLKQAKKLKLESGNDQFIYLYEVEGEVEILNSVNSGDGAYRAMVKNARTFVTKGSILVPGNMKKVQALDGEESLAAQGQIVGNLNDHKLISKDTFVVINKGAPAGYTQGKIIPIFMNANNRNENSVVVENQQKIGKTIIVDATQNYSVGYILKIYEQVYLNDFVGSNNGGMAGTAKHSDSPEDTPKDDFNEPEKTDQSNSEELDSTEL